MMPFSKDPGVRESDRYCSLCFQGGRLCYEGTNLKEFQKVSYNGMRKRGTSALLASFYTFMIRFAPRWRKS